VVLKLSDLDVGMPVTGPRFWGSGAEVCLQPVQQPIADGLRQMAGHTAAFWSSPTRVILVGVLVSQPATPAWHFGLAAAMGSEMGAVWSLVQHKGLLWL
jgi:hypothetical protein